MWEHIIIPLGRLSVFYPGCAGVDEGASVYEGYLFYTGFLDDVGVASVYEGAGVDKGTGVEEVSFVYTSSSTPDSLV